MLRWLPALVNVLIASMMLFQTWIYRRRILPAAYRRGYHDAVSEQIVNSSPN